MALSHQIQVELLNFQCQDFNEFLSCHRKVNSFQRVNHIFHIHVFNQNSEEYCAFVEGMKDSFDIEEFKDIKLCKAQCRDGTNCLNQANGNDLFQSYQNDEFDALQKEKEELMIKKK